MPPRLCIAPAHEPWHRTTSQPARRLAGAEPLVARDAAAAADANFDERTALRAVFRLVVCELAGFRFSLTGRAALRAGNRFQPLGSNRLAADFAQHGRLPVVVVIVDRSAGVARAASPCRSGTSSAARLRPTARPAVLVRIRLAAQQADQPQPRDGVVAAADGSPAAIAAGELVRKHRHRSES